MVQCSVHWVILAQFTKGVCLQQDNPTCLQGAYNLVGLWAFPSEILILFICSHQDNVIHTSTYHLKYLKTQVGSWGFLPFERRHALIQKESQDKGWKETEVLTDKMTHPNGQLPFSLCSQHLKTKERKGQTKYCSYWHLWFTRQQRELGDGDGVEDRLFQVTSPWISSDSFTLPGRMAIL